MTLTEQQIMHDIIRLNESLWKENQAVSRSMQELGYDLSRCVIFEMFPDSGSTWIVRLMGQGGGLVKLDIDINDSTYNSASVIDLSDYRKRSGQILLGVVRKLHGEKSRAQ